jgi:metal-sulfur cluster biosynthetic enzyme
MLRSRDPEIPINIVDLGLVYDVDVEGDRAHIKMTLTAPGCPMSAMIVDNVRQKVESIDGIKKAEVELVWVSPWTFDRISKK